MDFSRPLYASNAGLRIKNGLHELAMDDALSRTKLFQKYSKKKKRGEWDTPENHSKNIANDILKEKKLSGSGAGARSGQHGTPYNQAARELQKLAKEAEKKGDLPEGIKILRDKAKEFFQRAKELNHKM